MCTDCFCKIQFAARCTYSRVEELIQDVCVLVGVDRSDKIERMRKIRVEIKYISFNIM